MYKHKTLNMGEESPEAKNAKCWFCLLNFCAEIHAKVNWITCFSATQLPKIYNHDKNISSYTCILLDPCSENVIILI